jgi:hypothetical protein
MTFPADYLDTLFSDLPAAQSLLRQVRDFYGPTFRLLRHDAPDGVSRFRFDTGGEAMTFNEASILLNTTEPELERAAAFHELLHLSLPTRGFGVFNGRRYAPGYPGRFGAFVEHSIEEMINVVQHDIFVDDFVAAGLPLSQFLSTKVSNPSYNDEAKNARGRPKDWADWGWWSSEFLKKHLSTKHGMNAAAQLTPIIEKHANRVLPGFDAVAEDIRSWALQLRHREAATYPRAIQDLAVLLRLPVTLMFCALTPVSGSTPAVDQI